MFQVDRKKLAKLAKKQGKSELHVVADLGISQATFYRRINAGWSTEQLYGLCFLMGVKKTTELLTHDSVRPSK